MSKKWSREIGKQMPKRTDDQKADDLAWRTWRKWGVSGTKSRAAAEFQKMIRYESADNRGMVTCVTCGFQNHWRNSDNLMDCGHFVGGRSNSVAFLDDNANPQCVKCNRHLSGNLAVYQTWMVEKHGYRRVAEIKRLRNETKKLTAQELNVMRLEYRKRSKLAEKRLRELEQ